jgi:hypothetical protein
LGHTEKRKRQRRLAVVWLMEKGTCKLCLKEAELQDSHYIPRRAYSTNMAKSLKNPNPVVMSSGKLKQVSDQLRGRTFCSACEQLLSKKGEKWVLANIPDDQGKPFPLQDALIPEAPACIGDKINLYAGSKIKAFDMPQLLYFGVSMFWRAAAREWKSSLGDVAPPVDLGEYYEPIRQFLLGGPFPDDVVIFVYVDNLKPTGNAATTVLSAKNKVAEYLWFYLNGLGFALYLGKEIPKQIRQLCAYRSSEGFVIVDAEFGKMVRAFLKDRMISQPMSENLEQFLKGPDPRKKS